MLSACNEPSFKDRQPIFVFPRYNYIRRVTDRTNWDHIKKPNFRDVVVLKGSYENEPHNLKILPHKVTLV